MVTYYFETNAIIARPLIIAQDTFGDVFNPIEGAEYNFHSKFELSSLRNIAVPLRVLSDNGKQFDSEKYRKFWSEQNTQVTYISVNRPASNPVERVMTTLGNMLRLNSRDSHKRWHMFIHRK